jgi:hypothetical protein
MGCRAHSNALQARHRALRDGDIFLSGEGFGDDRATQLTYYHCRALQPRVCETIFYSQRCSSYFLGTLEQAFKSYHTFQENIKRHFDERSGLLKSANQSAKEAQEHARRCQAELTAIRRDILVNIAEAWRGEVLPDYIAPPSYRSGSSNEGITP